MEGQIRKLIQGTPKEGMAYVVGQKTKVGLLNEIMIDTEFFDRFGVLMYNVYVETEIGTQIWKKISADNCSIEYNLI
jgi:hypothetical protein